MDFDRFDRWLLDNKMQSTFRFEQRQLQLVGLLTILIVLLSPRLPPVTESGVIIFSLLTFLELLMIVIYLYFGYPRSSKFGLRPSFEKKPTSEDINNYITDLEKTLSKKATIMKISYTIFVLMIVLLLIYAMVEV